MTLYCALDDFVQHTLGAVPGRWAKLRYISELRAPNGSYAHWGLVRTYGKQAAQAAITEAHREVLLQMLRTPVRELLEDAAKSAEAAEVPLGAFLKDLSHNVNGLLPEYMGKASAQHFSSVLKALASLAQAGKGASRRVS